VVQHVVLECYLSLLVSNDGEPQITAADLIDVFDPAAMALNGVGRQADQLDAASGEFGLEFGERAQLGGADGGVVLGVREENDPLVADEVVEVDGTLCSIGVKVGSNGTEAETGCKD